MGISKEKVQAAVKAKPEGIGMAALAAELDAHRRTILRYLNELIDDGAVRREGGGRSTMYRVAHTSRAIPKEPDEPSSSPRYSTASATALARVKQPVAGRRPVGYEPAFLLEYDPTANPYLSSETREKLRLAGRLSDEQLPAGTYARRILDRLLIDLSWNSSRLEGNTYSLLETERLLEAGVEALDRDPLETQMILNHKAAIEFLVEGAGEIDFDRYSILNLHALLSDNLLHDPSEGGRLRNATVGISGSVFEPLQNPQQIEEYFDICLETARAIADPFEQALFTLVQLPYLQPFIDVNKRVSRLAANIPFIRENLCPLSFIDVSPRQYAHAMLAVYEQNDVSVLADIFVWAYERSAARYRAIRQSMGEPDAFRLRYRSALKQAVAEVIRARLPAKEEREFIVRLAEDLPAADQERFIGVVLEELDSLHEGNFRRYPVRPSEFRSWLDTRR